MVRNIIALISCEVVSRASAPCRGADVFKPGTIGVGMIQRISGALSLNAGVPVTPFVPPRGSFVMSSAQLELDALGKMDKDTPVDAQELVQWIQRHYHNHVFKPGQQFLTCFQDKVNLKLTVKGFEFVEADSAGA